MSDPDFTRPADTHPSAWPFPVELKASDATLRDYFAAKALQGLLANPERYRYIADLVDTHQLTQDEASAKNARKAYLIAAAMLAARSAK